MPKTVTVTINGRPHTVTELRPRANAEWRQRFEQALGGVATLVGELPDRDISSPRDLAALLRESAGTILGAADAMAELAIAYDPAFEEAYESEIADAFPSLLELAFPFGALVTRLRGLTAIATSGQPAPPTGPSSRSPSGDAGTMNSTPRRSGS